MKFKRYISLLLCVLTLMSCALPLVSCDGTTPGAPCTEHVDANKDGKCDTCGAEVTVKCDTHVDADKNNLCDNCGETMKEAAVGNTNYAVKVETVGGMPLEGVTVYVYNADNLICTLPKETDKNGAVVFELKTSTEYTVYLDGVPEGYNVKTGDTKEDRYPMLDRGTTIMLSSAPIKNEPFSDSYKLGDVMHDFTLTDVEGNTYTLSEVLKEKKMVMLNYWYAECTWCLKEFPGINASYKKYDDVVELLAINDYGDSFNTIKQFPTTGQFANKVDEEGNVIEDNNLVFPLVKVEKKTSNLIRDKFVGEGYPTTVIIDRYGVICFMEAGAIIGESKWDKIFSHFTADDYDQKLITSAEELTPPELPTVTWGGSEGIANNFNGSDDLVVEYAPETSEKDALYSWPFIPTTVGSISAIRPSNSKVDNSYAILYAEIQLKPGQAVMFDYFVSTEYGEDNLYVLVDGKDICTLTGVNLGDKTDPNSWEQCCAYVDPRPVTAENKDVLVSYRVSFTYLKNTDTSVGDDTVYMKNLRVIDAQDIPIHTYIFRYAATDPFANKSGYETYVDYVLHTDGYYHVVDAEGNVGPLLFANFLGYTNFDSKQTMSQRITSAGEFLVNNVDKYNYWMIYANASANSKIYGYTPITEELKTFLDAYCEQYHFDAGKIYDENLWLQLCIYYDAYGKDSEGNKAPEVENPILGLTTFSAYETSLPDPQVNDAAKFTVKYESVIMPRGYLYRFVPTKSGVYRVTSFSDQEVTGWIFTGTNYDWADSENGERILLANSEREERLCPELHIKGEDGKVYRDNNNVSLVAYMEAGKEYFIDIAYYDLYAVGEFEFEIKYVGEKFNAFVMASPGPVTYIESASGGIGQLIALGIDYAFKVDETDGKTYAYHVVGKDENGDIIYGSKIYADFYYPTIPFPSQSIVQLAALGAFDFSMNELDIDAINYLVDIRNKGKDAIIDKWVKAGSTKTDAEELWNSKNLDELVKLVQKGSDVSSYPAEDVAIAKEALAEGIFLLKRTWGIDAITEEKWTEYNMDEVLRNGTFSTDEETSAYQRATLADIDKLWNKTYQMDDVAAGIYHGEAGDKTAVIQQYIALMENDESVPERQGCVAVTKELSEILSLLFSKYVFDDVAHDWLKFCFYYDQLGTYVQ